MFESLLPHIPAGVTPWVYYLCVGGAVIVTGVSKSGFGGGTGILAVPLMALVLGSDHMLGLMLPLLIACDVLSNLHFIGEQDWKRLRPLLIGASVGVAGGTTVLLALHSQLPPKVYLNAMNAIVGVICLAVVLAQAYRLTGRELPTLPSHPLSAVGVGVLAGTVSTINHSAGPIVTVYFLQEKLTKRILVGSMLFYFLVINSVKVLPYTLILHNTQGEPFINGATLHDSIWFIPLIPAGTLLGAWMNTRVSERMFSGIMYTAAGVAAVWLLYKAFV